MTHVKIGAVLQLTDSFVDSTPKSVYSQGIHREQSADYEVQRFLLWLTEQEAL